MKKKFCSNLNFNNIPKLYSYIPQCSPSCNSGKCVNNNLCDCSSTPFIGRYCNEYKKLTKSKTLIFTARILAVFIAITTILLMGKVYTLKNNPQLKAGMIFYIHLLIYIKQNKKNKLQLSLLFIISMIFNIYIFI